MSQSNTLSPAAANQDADLGSTSPWVNTGNIVSSNNTYTTSEITSVATNIYDKEVKLRIGYSVASIYAPDNLASGVAWGTVDGYTVYGDESEDWGATLSKSLIEDEEFGLGMSCETDDTVPLYTGTLYGYDFGFILSDSNIPVGVSARIEKRATWDSRSAKWTMRVDHYELTVYSISNRLRSLLGVGYCWFFFKLLCESPLFSRALSLSGILNSQTRNPKKIKVSYVN